MKEVNIISKVVGRSGAEASPSSVAIMPNMSGYATKTELNTLRNEFKDFLEGDDVDVIINKWKDLVSFLEGISEDFDLLTMLGLKADKTELGNYVTLSTEQAISGKKDFLNGLSIGGLGITKSQDDVIYLDANLVVRGGITMFGTGADVDVPTIMNAIATDGVNLKVVDGVLTFVGSSGSGLTEVRWDDVIGRPTLLSSFIDDVVQGNYLPLSGGQMTGRVEFKTNSIYGVEINRLDSQSPVIHFCSDGNSYGYIGFDGVNKPTYYDNGFRPREILHAGNWTKYISAGEIGAYLPLSGGNMSGHIFMMGAVADSSTANTSQIVFGTPGNNHVCLTSNMKGLIINPSLNDTSGQIALYADSNMESFIQSSLKVYGSLYANLYFNHGGSVGKIYNASMYAWDNNLQINKTTLNYTWVKAMMNFDLASEDISINVDGMLKFNSYIYWKSDSNNPHMAIVHGSYTWYLQAYENKYIYLGNGVSNSIRIDSVGNLLNPGGITMYSDIRKKTKLQDVELSLQQIADAPLIEHYYTSDEKRTTHVGSIAQYWASMNDWFCKLDGEGYYTMEIQNAALASAISIARELVKYESKTDKEIRLLKDEVRRLKKEIKTLKSV